MAEPGNQEGNTIQVRRRVSAAPGKSTHKSVSISPPPVSPKTFTRRGVGKTVGAVVVGGIVENEVLNRIVPAQTFSGESAGAHALPVASPTLSEATPTVPPVPAPRSEATPTPEPVSRDPRLVKGIPQRLAPIFIQAAEEKNIPPKVLSAISRHETGGEFKNDLKQKEFGLGRGIMQIDLGAHPNVSEKQAFDPIFAINYAADLLLKAHKKHDPDNTDWDNAIRAYNAGDNFDSEKKGYDHKTPIRELANNYLAKVKAILNEG
jgi:hypothetical protein